jgi:uncharacterized protein YsxB (DUF464 family)
MIHILAKDCALEVRGHAGAAPYGSDVVCAGVSALCYCLARNLEAEEGRGCVEGVFCAFRPGEAVLRCRKSRAGRALFTYAVRGLELMAAQYPRFVELERKER